MTHCVSILVGLSVSLTLVGQAAAQKDLPVPKSTAAEYPVTITGCIHGTRFIPQSASSATASDAVRASEYVLDGPKEVMQIIRKEHNGHLDEITGVIEVPAQPAAERTAIGNAPVGKKGRITIATREESGGFHPAPHPVRVKVTSLRHISKGCSTNRS